MKNTKFTIHGNTKFYINDLKSKPLTYSLSFLFRDFKKVFNKKPILVDSLDEADIIIKNKISDKFEIPEFYKVEFNNKKDSDGYNMIISGINELGTIYGILHISTYYLKIDPFWFWTDLEPKKRDFISIDIKNFYSYKRKVKYRGWFVNDEVCLIGWTDEYPPPKRVWEPVFETLLRCGGNMVIPGTDLPRKGIHWQLAKDMGLYITHHHAEPLGAEMFARAYPKLEPSYKVNANLYELLWRKSIESQKEDKVIWTLGFRGQGDCPFWENDSTFKTSKSRGDLISSVIDKQYKILKEYIKDPICITYLYGEIMELYKEGHIKVSKKIIKIWSDNGYGKMVSRRQGNSNPRINSLPKKIDDEKHGLYYHITFHDLQASNHLTMFQNSPLLIKNNLENAFSKNANMFLLLNCGNIRQHIYPLDIVNNLWNDGTINIETHIRKFIKRYLDNELESIVECYKDFFEATPKYGINLDDKAGDEFYHHPIRIIIASWIKNETLKSSEKLKFISSASLFSEQVDVFYNIVKKSITKFIYIKEKLENILKLLSGYDRQFVKDHIIYHVDLHLTGCKGAENLCKSYFYFKQKDYIKSFIYCSKSLWNYQDSLNVLKESEHGKWKNFYRSDWLTNIKITIYNVDSLRRYIRIHGDSPNFFNWFKNYLLPDSEKNIYLENTQRRTLSDDELTKLLMDKFKIISD